MTNDGGLPRPAQGIHKGHPYGGLVVGGTPVGPGRRSDELRGPAGGGLPRPAQGEEGMLVQTPAVRTSSCCSGEASRSSLEAISLFKAFM